MQGLCNCAEQGGGVACQSFAWVIEVF